MKETVKSLRTYFVIAGLLSGYANVTSLMSGPGLIVMVLNGAALLVALGFLYLGAVLPGLLAQSTDRIYLILALAAALNGLHGALALAFGAAIFAIIVPAVGLLICWYLYANVKRLAAEARAQSAK